MTKKSPWFIKDRKINIALVGCGRISHNHLKAIASFKNDFNLVGVVDIDESIAKEVLEAWPDKVAEYQSGKKGVLGLFMGDLMKKSKGKADPKKASAILQKLLG